MVGTRYSTLLQKKKVAAVIPTARASVLFERKRRLSSALVWRMTHRRTGGRGGEHREVTENFASLVLGDSRKPPEYGRVLSRTASKKFLRLHVCVCVFFSFILDIKFVGRTSRGHTGGRSHRISRPPSFCGACLNFSREKDSAIPFPRRPWSRILCTNDLIVLHPLGIFISVFLFFSEKNPVSRDRTHVPTCQRVTRYL